MKSTKRLRSAVCADITEMFYQISIQDSDMHAQQFLWLHKNNQTSGTFVMRSMTFWLNCALCIAHNVHHKNAEEIKNLNPLANKPLTLRRRSHWLLQRLRWINCSCTRSLYVNTLKNEDPKVLGVQKCTWNVLGTL